MGDETRAVTSRNTLGRAPRPRKFWEPHAAPGRRLLWPCVPLRPVSRGRPLRTPPSRPCRGARAPSRAPCAPRAPLTRVSAALPRPRLPRWSRQIRAPPLTRPLPTGSTWAFSGQSSSHNPPPPPSSPSSWSWASRGWPLSLAPSLFLICWTIPSRGGGSTGFWDLRLGFPKFLK